MKLPKVNKSLYILFFLTLFLFPLFQNFAGSSSISATVFGSPLVISTSLQMAGAITSLTWRGIEFINAADHGRELQSASSFDGFGECFNPTEGGSVTDGTKPVSTSVLQGLSAIGNQLKTTTQMAFWTPMNYAYPSGCGTSGLKISQNTNNLSNHVFSKQVTIGTLGIENAIEYIVNFHVSEAHSSATFEFLTSYMPNNFSSFWTYNPQTGALASLSHVSGEQSFPLIFSTQDRAYAMGVYSPEIANVGYGRFDFSVDHVVKWNAVSRRAETPTGDYGFRAYVFVGSLQQVMASMTAARQAFILMDTKLYNYDYYISKYKDLRHSDGSFLTPDEASNHWVRFGIDEGRQGVLTFKASEYLALYGDMRTAFGANGFRQAALHFFNSGYTEGRGGRISLSPLVFDATWYINANVDLKNAGFNQSQGVTHWLNSGIYEGRVARSDFSVTSYLNHYADLKAAFGNNYEAAIAHFVQYGKAEGRSGAP